MKYTIFSLWVVSLLISIGCGGLPDNFAKLSLKDQVDAYERHLQDFGRPRLYAQSHIAWHGWAAADLMAEYLNGKRSGLPKYEAVQIINLVQLRGCSLRGTAAEGALVKFIAHGKPDEMERQAAESALDSIRRNVIVRAGPDSLNGGPCKTH